MRKVKEDAEIRLEKHLESPVKRKITDFTSLTENDPRTGRPLRFYFDTLFKFV